MSLAELNVSGFRNLSIAGFCPEQGFNVVLGDNGAGKSSLLEAIYLLGTGKSFRTHHPLSLIHMSASAFQVLGVLSPLQLSLAVERQATGEQRILLQGEGVRSASELAAIFPVLAMTLNDDQLFEGSPKVRRQFLDWGVFHVEHDRSRLLFHHFQRAIKQRNSALKSVKLSHNELTTWTREFIVAAERLDQVRAAYFEQLVVAFETICQSASVFAFGQDLTLHYSRGWDKKLSLAEALVRPATQARERETGLTMVGPQRADIRLMWQQLPAKEVLSRGQKKVLAYCLKLAQLKCLLAQGAPKPVILVDDLSAELDQAHLLALLKQLSEFNTQTFLTALDDKQFPDPQLWGRSAQINKFHLRNGQILGCLEGDRHG